MEHGLKRPAPVGAEPNGHLQRYHAAVKTQHAGVPSLGYNRSAEGSVPVPRTRPVLITVAVLVLALWGGGAALAAQIATRPPLHRVSTRLSGQMHGTDTMSHAVPDIGSQSSLSGSGRLSVGLVTLSGSLHGTGFIARGYCTGSLGLRTTQGTLLLGLRSSSASSGFTTCVNYSWHIVSATGKYRGQFGTGLLSITTRADAFTLSFG
jgi:hypothetical protein